MMLFLLKAARSPILWGTICGCALLALPGGASLPKRSAAKPTAAIPEPVVMNLWDHEPPGYVPGGGSDSDDGTGRIRNVNVPAMLVYLPKKSNRPAAALIACPGGGYTHLTRLAGADGAVAAFLPRGMAVIALKYRTTPPSNHVERDALADAIRAVRLVRAHAAEWGIDPQKVGVLGWSAGANLALNLATHWDNGAPGAIDPVDQQSSRPRFIALMSPWPNGRTLSSFPVGRQTPPAFICTALDDRTAPSSFAREIWTSYRSAGVHSELWEVATGGHGAFTIGTKGEGGKWVDRFWPWLEQFGIRKR